MDQDMGRIVGYVKGRIRDSATRAFTVSIMGQTGVGKSSLINALFGTDLKTDPVKPCTKVIEEVQVQDAKGDLVFYDLPGIGECADADDGYMSSYLDRLLHSDVVVWAIHADNRSVTFDRAALDVLLSGLSDSVRSILMSKIIFALTKADLITPSPWFFANTGQTGIFVPSEQTTQLLDAKTLYFQSQFLLPYRDLLTSSTYNDGSFDVQDARFNYNEYAVECNGYLSPAELAEWQQRAPQHASVFQRLYDNYRVIPCSARFRYNLPQLMLLVVNKLGEEAIDRLGRRLTVDTLNRVPAALADSYINIQYTKL
jgi:uncharacterized protein